ncbi:MAG: Chondroitin synthase [Pelotomaculum sp. PtaB.Bin104]|jgi:glycosyltransferase involved in cell wall biosynthesis|nr:MAG: Chondroitin synthase [Pelotomaculum sp. PtaB.Bin104]
MPQISVVIPTYNRADYIIDAVNSVLSQTYTNYEIIVVDDGSTDNTKLLLQPYLNKIQYIYQPNKGVSAARNAGIREARGEWIAFLDSDDEWLPGKLEAQIEDIDRYPKAVLSCTNISFEGHGSKSIELFRECVSYLISKTELIQNPIMHSFVCTPTVLAKRDSINAVGMFDEQLTIYEDIDLWFRLSTVGEFIANPLVLAKAYRRNEKSDVNLSAQYLTKQENSCTSLIKVYEKISRYDLSQQEKKYIKKKISDCYFDLGLINYSLQKYGQAQKYYYECFRKYPSLKTLMKLLLGQCGQFGVDCVTKRRERMKGFRRSEVD